jgi:hypothetical protein
MPRKSQPKSPEPPEQKEKKQLNNVFIRVFLSPPVRKKFRIACAEEEVSMSEKARELIENWVEGQDDELP